MDPTACTEPQCLYNGALYLFTTARIHGVKNFKKESPKILMNVSVSKLKGHI